MAYYTWCRIRFQLYPQCIGRWLMYNTSLLTQTIPKSHVHDTCRGIQCISRIGETRSVSLSAISGKLLCRTGLVSPTLHQNTHIRRCFSMQTQILKDVILFEHDRTGFFRLLALFCCGQFLFWTYLAHFAYTGLRDTGASKKNEQAGNTTGLAGLWSFEMNLGSNVWRYGFTIGCLGIGGVILGLGVLFCRRSVRQVILHGGGRMVTVSTQSPFRQGKGRRIHVPLSQVACHAHRQESPSFIPLRVKGHKFYFLLDKDGTINNAKLFDVTVGAYRAV